MVTDSPSAELAAPQPPTYRLGQLVRYALKLGATGFGGPVALVGYMQRDLVERRKWISEDDFKEGLALAQLAPGPLAAQLAIYLGYVHYHIWGATLVGLAFVLPSFLMVVALGWLYCLYGGLEWMQAVFYGVGAAVIGIIAHSAYKLTRRTIGSSRLLWVMYTISVAVTIVTESEWITLFLISGLIYWLANSKPRWLSGTSVKSVAPAAMLLLAMPVAVMPEEGLVAVFLFFAKAGAFIFGSGLAIVPFLYSGVVQEHGWLTERQFVDAVAVAMITPGPVVITVGFIGYLMAGFPGALVASLGTFLPCYFFTILPAPYFKKYGRRPGIVSFIDGVTAAAVGTITGAVVVLGKRSVIDTPTVIIAVVTLALLWRFKKLPEPVVIVAAALLGLAIYPIFHPS